VKRAAVPEGRDEAQDDKLAQAQIDATLAALADPTRRAVIDLLRQGPHRAGELAAALQITAPTLSRHMRVLRHNGLVIDEEPDHDARVRLYRLRREAFATLRGWLDEVEAFWGGQLDSFKAHAEKKPAAKRAAR
jgi:DNA-binding transcriptional ArsR family regulator